MWTSLALLLFAFPSQDAVSAPEAIAPALEHVVVVGASVSDGFGLKDEVQARVDLSDYFRAALRSEQGALTTRASGYFFMDPLGRGAELFREAMEEEPTLLIAMDFLFWFGYGPIPDEYRPARLERGLELLDAARVPLLIADFPDMTRALEGTSPMGPMMFPNYIPSEETRVALNTRIHAWAAAREDTFVLPLARYVGDVFAGKAIEVHGQKVPGDAKRLLQSDLLHPSSLGNVLLALFILDHLFAAGVVPEDQVHWSVEVVEARLLEQTREEREKNLERERKREERRKRSAERKAKEEAEKAGHGNGALRTGEAFWGIPDSRPSCTMGA